MPGSSWDKEKKSTEVKEEGSGWCSSPPVSGHDKAQTIERKAGDAKEVNSWKFPITSPKKDQCSFLWNEWVGCGVWCQQDPALLHSVGSSVVMILHKFTRILPSDGSVSKFMLQTVCMVPYDGFHWSPHYVFSDMAVHIITTQMWEHSLCSWELEPWMT